MTENDKSLVHWNALLSGPVLGNSIQQAQADGPCRRTEEVTSYRWPQVYLCCHQQLSSSPDQLWPRWAGWPLGARTKVHLDSWAQQEGSSPSTFPLHSNPLRPVKSGLGTLEHRPPWRTRPLSPLCELRHVFPLQDCKKGSCEEALAGQCRSLGPDPTTVPIYLVT